jgi:hypothetical protein
MEQEALEWAETERRSSGKSAVAFSPRAPVIQSSLLTIVGVLLERRSSMPEPLSQKTHRKTHRQLESLGRYKGICTHE